MTDTPLQILLEATIKPGQADALRNLARTAPSTVQQNEPGTLDYRWLVEDGGTRARFMDLYASSGAFLTHFQNAQKSGFLDQIMGCVDFTNVHVLGTPDAAAREVLDGFGAVYFQQVGGFNRVAPVVTATR